MLHRNTFTDTHSYLGFVCTIDTICAIRYLGNMATKHRIVFEHVEELIVSGAIGVGDTLPGEIDLSKNLGVSRNTVRHAMQELSSKYRIERTPGRGTVYLGELSDSVTTKSIGFINSSLMYTIYPEMVHAIEDGLYHGGYSMILANGNYDPEKEQESARRMLSHGVLGLIVEPMNSGLLAPDSGIVKVLNDAGVPVLTTNCVIPGLDASYITVDDERIGCQAVEYLVNRGHRRIAIVYKSDTQAGSLRFDGYRRGLSAAAIELDEELVRSYTQDEEDLIPGAWYTRQILDETDGEQRPTAFIYFNDQLALQAYPVFQEYSLSIPDDVSVIGIDNIPEAAHVSPGISTFNHPKYLMGKLAAEMMLARLGPHNDRLHHGVVMRANLVERESVRSLR